MKVNLVTGGAGFIGSHLVEGLLKNGKKVRVLDNFSTGLESNLKPFESSIEVVEGDIRDSDIAKKAMKDVEFIYHTAANRAVEKSVEKPFETHDVNVSGTLNLLCQAKEAGAKRLIFSSSSAVYGEIKTFPVKEDFELNPQSPYGLSKLISEQYCTFFANVLGFDTVNLRYFNAFGPRQTRESQYALVIPVFVDSLLKKESPELHWDGKQSRDFVHIDNIVQANFLSAEGPDKKGAVYNIASGDSISILDLFNKIRDDLGITDIEPTFTEKRPGDVRKTLADIEKAKSELNYKLIKDLDSGLKETVEWFVGYHSEKGIGV